MWRRAWLRAGLGSRGQGSKLLSYQRLWWGGKVKGGVMYNRHGLHSDCGKESSCKPLIQKNRYLDDKDQKVTHKIFDGLVHLNVFGWVHILHFAAVSYIHCELSGEYFSWKGSGCIHSLHSIWNKQDVNKALSMLHWQEGILKGTSIFAHALT